MDNSSRNIVKFIVTITVAALLIMGARYYAQSQKPAKPEEVAEKAVAPKTVPAETVETGAFPDPEAGQQDPGGQIIEEDAELIMGEPSMNLEQGGTPPYTPPVQSEPATAPQPEQ
jgi:hypothetical protein